MTSKRCASCFGGAFLRSAEILANAEDILEAAIERATRSSDIALEAEPEAHAALTDGIRQAAEDGLVLGQPHTTGFERCGPQCRGTTNNSQRPGAPLQRHLPAFHRARGSTSLGKSEIDRMLSAVHGDIFEVLVPPVHILDGFGHDFFQ